MECAHVLGHVGKGWVRCTPAPRWLRHGYRGCRPSVSVLHCSAQTRLVGSPRQLLVPCSPLLALRRWAAKHAAFAVKVDQNVDGGVQRWASNTSLGRGVRATILWAASPWRCPRGTLSTAFIVGAQSWVSVKHVVPAALLTVLGEGAARRYLLVPHALGLLIGATFGNCWLWGLL